MFWRSLWRVLWPTNKKKIGSYWIKGEEDDGVIWKKKYLVKLGEYPFLISEKKIPLSRDQRSTLHFPVNDSSNVLHVVKLLLFSPVYFFVYKYPRLNLHLLACIRYGTLFMKRSPDEWEFKSTQLYRNHIAGALISGYRKRPRTISLIVIWKKKHF